MTRERLPLFPLGTVLLPGMVLPLHIFEPRYQLMMQQVLEGDRSFGVLLIRRGSEVGQPAEPYNVGTVAEVTTVVPLDDGRMNISTIGRERFKVTAFYHDQPFLTGDVAYLSDAYNPSEGLTDLQAEVERLGMEYVTTVLTLRAEHRQHVQLPADPLTLSYKVAGLLAAMQPHEVQDLLQSRTLEHRLLAEVLLLRRELAILRRMSEMDGGRLSPN
jgi:Lon protease-like protein